jgi:signal transduction histidine kinase
VGDEQAAQIEVLWLDALQRVAGRAAHEIKGALNGVSVNLEVVRSRAAHQAAAPASGLARFAEAAASQLEELVAMSEALLALTRRPREVVDVLATAGHLVALLGPAARADGYSLAISGQPTNGWSATSAPAAVVRLVLGSVMLCALDRRIATTCRVDAPDGMVIRVECADGGTIELDPRVAEVATAAGIRVDAGPDGLSLAFPRAGRPSGRRTAPTRETA